MALRLSQEEFTRGVQTYSRDMYRAARALTPCDADAQDAVGQAVLLAWQSLDRLRDPEALRACWRRTRWSTGTCLTPN